jgi:hypothetical protein
MRDGNDGLVGELQFFTVCVLVEEEIDVFVDDFWSWLHDRLFFGLRLSHI